MAPWNVGIIQPTNEITVENLVMVWLQSIFWTGYFIGFFWTGVCYYNHHVVWFWGSIIDWVLTTWLGERTLLWWSWHNSRHGCDNSPMLPQFLQKFSVPFHLYHSWNKFKYYDFRTFGVMIRDLDDFSNLAHSHVRNQIGLPYQLVMIVTTHKKVSWCWGFLFLGLPHVVYVWATLPSSGFPSTEH